MLDPHAFCRHRRLSRPLLGDVRQSRLWRRDQFPQLHRAREIDGVETGSEFGSFGSFNNYLRAGKKFPTRELGDFDISLFGSDLRGDGYLARGAHEFEQGKVLATWTPVPTDRLTFKFVVNNSFAEFMNRSSLTQFYTNPYGKTINCRIATHRQSALLQQSQRARQWLLHQRDLGARQSERLAARHALACDARHRGLAL